MDTGGVETEEVDARGVDACEPDTKGMDTRGVDNCELDSG